MQFLKRGDLFCLIVISLCGCATSSFKILYQGKLAVELQATPDRVLLECEYQHDNDTKGLYGFLIHLLDEEKTVLTVAQNNTLTEVDCTRRIKKIGKILNTGRSVYIGGMGDLTEPRIKGTRSYIFPHIGTFYDNGRSLQFSVIANEKGLCYDAYSGDEAPCPREPFPIKERKKP